MSGIQTSKRTDSLIGLIGLFGLLALGTWLAANSPATQPAAATGAQSTQTAPELTEVERWAIPVVYAEKCHAELPPTFVLGLVVNLESFPAEIAQAAHDKAMKNYFRGPSSWCYAFGIGIRHMVREFLAD